MPVVPHVRLAFGLTAAALIWSPAQAAEIHLFDGDNCTGEVRMLDRSVSDLRHIGFDNRVNSFIAITGAWAFFRDAGFQSGNGPAFGFVPPEGGPLDTCVQLDGIADGAFPPDRLSAVRLEEETQGPSPEGIAILYDFQHFGGEYRILTRSVKNFTIIDFDNEVESVRVLKGEWEFYRNPDFEAPDDRPGITLGPGDYPDIASVPGFPLTHFPADLMSSARVAEPAPVAVPPADCLGGQIPGDSQCHFCWDYFGNEAYSSWPVGPEKSCSCAYANDHRDQLTAVSDGVTFRNCVPQ